MEIANLSLEDVKTDRGSSSNREIMEELECPVCFEFMFDNIVMCQEGHNFCNGCSTKLKECPICRQKICGIRNKALEKMASRMIVSCRYHAAGCLERSTAMEIRKHQEVCPHRLYSCIVDSQHCSWKGQLHQLVPHMQEEHHEQLCLDRKLSFICSKMENDKNVDLAHILENELFIVHRHCNVEKQYFYVTVQYLGPPEKAKQFKYTVKLFTLDSLQIAMYRSITLPETAKVEQIFESFNCACWGLDFVKTFMKNNELWYTVEISYK